MWGDIAKNPWTTSDIIRPHFWAAGGQRPSRPVFYIQKPSAIMIHHKPWILLAFISLYCIQLSSSMWFCLKVDYPQIWWFIIILWYLSSFLIAMTVIMTVIMTSNSGLQAIHRCLHSLQDIPGSPRVHRPDPGDMLELAAGWIRCASRILNLWGNRKTSSQNIYTLVDDMDWYGMYWYVHFYVWYHINLSIIKNIYILNMLSETAFTQDLETGTNLPKLPLKTLPCLHQQHVSVIPAVTARPDSILVHLPKASQSDA